MLINGFNLRIFIESDIARLSDFKHHAVRHPSSIIRPLVKIQMAGLYTFIIHRQSFPCNDPTALQPERKPSAGRLRLSSPPAPSRPHLDSRLALARP